jgi:hypothetical protein
MSCDDHLSSKKPSNRIIHQSVPATKSIKGIPTKNQISTFRQLIWSSSLSPSKNNRLPAEAQSLVGDAAIARYGEKQYRVAPEPLRLSANADREA